MTHGLLAALESLMTSMELTKVTLAKLADEVRPNALETLLRALQVQG
jgi:RNA-binding protein YhbY